MSNRNFALGAATAALLALANSSAHANTMDVNMAGWVANGGFADPLNSQVFLNLGVGATISSFDYIELTFSTTSPASRLNDFFLSVNNSDGSLYIDAVPSATNAGGTAGPLTGTWATAPGGSFGAPFVAANGIVWVTAWDIFNDAGIDATVAAGTLRINYTPAPVPEPGSYALMGLGLLGLGAVVRRRAA